MYTTELSWSSLKTERPTFPPFLFWMMSVYVCECVVVYECMGVEERREITDTIIHTLTHTPLENGNISNMVTKSSKIDETCFPTCSLRHLPIPLLRNLSNIDGVPAHKQCKEKLEAGRRISS